MPAAEPTARPLARPSPSHRASAARSAAVRRSPTGHNEHDFRATVIKLLNAPNTASWAPCRTADVGSLRWSTGRRLCAASAPRFSNVWNTTYRTNNPRKTRAKTPRCATLCHMRTRARAADSCRQRTARRTTTRERATAATQPKPRFLTTPNPSSPLDLLHYFVLLPYVRARPCRG